MKAIHAPLLTLAAASIALLLSACAGTSSNSSGSFFGESGKFSTASIIVVDGDTITWGKFHCNNAGKVDTSDSETSIGTLDKSRTTVAWTQSGEYSGTDPYTESEDGSVITMSGFTYAKAGTVAGDALLTAEQEECDAEAERKNASATKAEEQSLADEKIRATFENTVRDILARSEFSVDDGSIGQVIEENGLDIETFESYLYRQYGYSVQELDFAAFVAPDELKDQMTFLK